MNVNLAIYALVAVAAATLGYVFWQLVSAACNVRAGRLDQEMTRLGMQQRPQIERFISPGHLLQLRLAGAVLPGILVPTAFMLAGFVNPYMLAAFGAASALGGGLLPGWYYKRCVRKRQEKFEDRILDLTQGLANALRSGMAFPQALERMTVRMKGAMREELEIVQTDYLLNKELSEAFHRLAERMPCEDIRLLASAVELTNRTGGSLAEVLMEMTETIRQRREFQNKVKILTAQGRFEGIALGVMPIVAFFVFRFLPSTGDMMGLLFTTTTGWCMLGLAAALEIIGFLVIMKISKVEV